MEEAITFSFVSLLKSGFLDNQMSLEELTQRATITFPLLATVEDVERLFGYFRQEAGLIIDYSLNINKRIGNEFEEPKEQDRGIVRSYELKGRISVPSSSITDTIKGSLESWDFQCPANLLRWGFFIPSDLQFILHPAK